VAAVFAAQLALNYPSFADARADVCVTIRIHINLLRQSNLQLEGPFFWSCEALGRLPKAKASTGFTSNLAGVFCGAETPSQNFYIRH